MGILVNPAVAAIPYGDRKRIMELCGGREDLVDLMSGNPYQMMPDWIRRRTMELFHSRPMRYTHYWGMPELRQRTFTLQGFSKSYFMMGMRIGYLTGPQEVMLHIKQLHYLIMLCPSRMAQYAALAALDCPAEYLEPMHREYREKLGILYDGIRRIPGVSCVEPNGSFYVFPNFSSFGLSSMDLAAKLIEEASVMTLPGTEFGPAGEGYLRLSVVSDRDRVEQGVERLLRFAQGRSGHGGR